MSRVPPASLPVQHQTSHQSRQKTEKGSRPAPAPEWKIGDTVYLKSGSPRMTVAALVPLDSGPHVRVVWTKYDDGTMQETILPAATFRKDWK